MAINVKGNTKVVYIVYGLLTVLLTVVHVPVNSIAHYQDMYHTRKPATDHLWDLAFFNIRSPPVSQFLLTVDYVSSCAPLRLQTVSINYM